MVVGDDRGGLSDVIGWMKVDGEEFGGPGIAGMNLLCPLSEPCTLHH